MAYNTLVTRLLLDQDTYLVAQVGVDAHQLPTVDSSSALHMHRASAVTLAVAARPVNLAVIVGIEVDDVHVATAVMLNDLIGGFVSATADNVGCAAALDGDGILADVLEPHKFKRTRSKAVHAFALIRANNDVSKLRPIFKNENSVLFT